MKRVVLFADGLTYPGKEGVSQHVMNLLHSLSNEPDFYPVLIMCDRGTISSAQLADLPWTTVLVPHELYYEYGKIKPVLDEIQPDIVQSYSVYQARLIASRYSVERHIPLVMEHHDIDSEFVANYNHVSEVHNFQLDDIELASLNRTLSFRDETILKDCAPSRAHTFVNIPTAIDEVPAERSSRDPTHVVFIGNGAYPPNRRALDYIAGTLAPVLPEITFHLVGRLTDLYTDRSPNLIAHGMIDDLGPILSQASFGIAPLDLGSGLKTKVLTYLSAGLPVVGTDIAFQGFDASPALIETALDDFTAVLSRTVRATRPDLSAIAAHEYHTRYGNEANFAALLARYRTLSFDAAINPNNTRPLTFDIQYLPWLKEFREKGAPEHTTISYINYSRPNQ